MIFDDGKVGGTQGVALSHRRIRMVLKMGNKGNVIVEQHAILGRLQSTHPGGPVQRKIDNGVCTGDGVDLVKVECWVHRDPIVLCDTNVLALNFKAHMVYWGGDLVPFG